IEAFVQQTLAQPASLIGRIDCQVINMSATSVVSAQGDSNNCRSINRYSTEPWVAREKLSDAFSVIALGDLKAFNSTPDSDRCVVILMENSRVSRLPLICS